MLLMNVAAEQSLARFLESPTRFLFFTGKGGVGKTSLACASAIALADGGKRVGLITHAERFPPGSLAFLTQVSS